MRYSWAYLEENLYTKSPKPYTLHPKPYTLLVVRSGRFPAPWPGGRYSQPWRMIEHQLLLRERIFAACMAIQHCNVEIRVGQKHPLTETPEGELYRLGSRA